MENRQIMDLGAMTSFKDNLFEKKVGGLRTSLNKGSEGVYNVEWNASRLDLGSIYGPGSDLLRQGRDRLIVVKAGRIGF